MSEARLFAATTFTEIYERVLVGPLFRPFAERLIARIALAHGDSVIDVACGTGIVARVARERLGSEARIVGVDVAPAMLAVARTVDSTIASHCERPLRMSSSICSTRITVLRMTIPASAIKPSSAVNPNGALKASRKPLAPMIPSGAVKNTRNSLEKLCN